MSRVFPSPSSHARTRASVRGLWFNPRMNRVHWYTAPNAIGNAFRCSQRAANIAWRGENPANFRSRSNCGCVGARVRITNQRKCHRFVCTGPRVHTVPLLFRQSAHVATYIVYRETPATCNLTSSASLPSTRATRTPSNPFDRANASPRLASPRPLVHPAAAILLPLKHRWLIIRLCRFNHSAGLEIRGWGRSQRRGIGNGKWGGRCFDDFRFQDGVRDTEEGNRRKFDRSIFDGCSEKENGNRKWLRAI